MAPWFYFGSRRSLDGRPEPADRCLGTAAGQIVALPRAMTTRGDLWERALAFMDAQTPLTAHDLGVFDALGTRAMPVDQVADVIGIDASTCSRLLAMLTALELVLRRADGMFFNTSDVDEALVRGRRGYVGALFTYVRRVVYPAWNHLDRALAERVPQCHRVTPDRSNVQETMFEDPECLRPFLAGLHALTYASAVQFAEQSPEVNGLPSIVDVGGATGAFLIALAEHHATPRGTVFDLPQVAQSTEESDARHMQQPQTP